MPARHAKMPWLESCKNVMTSLLSLLTSNRRKICVQFSTGFWQKKTLSTGICEHASCGFFVEKTDIENFALMHNPSRISVTVCYFVTLRIN
jgi:hypothetical protein